MLSFPTASPVVLHVAVPPLSFAVPSALEPFINVTVPVGAPDPPAAVTVAFSTTACPLAAGFNPLLSVTLVLAGMIPVWFKKTVTVPFTAITTSGSPSPFTSPT
jgi:hypothetical protein